MGDYRITFAGICALLAAVIAPLPVLGDGFSGYPTLWESHDPGLQGALDRTVRKLGLQRAVDQEKLSVTLVDITDIDDPRVADVNGNHMMYAASLPKIAILLGAFVEIERGKLDLDNDLFGAMNRMIRQSSNTDATDVLNIVGKDRVNQILQSNRFRLYDPATNGGLWVGKEYARGVAYRRDPLHNLSHGATALQTARFYYLLESGQLVNSKLSRLMKFVLSRPAISHKFVKALEKKPQVEMFRKSGTWRHFHADSAIVEVGRHKYILTALAEDPKGGAWLEAIAADVHTYMAPTKLAARQ